jgi:hypothetical protein
MSAADYLKMYAQGWAQGHENTIMSALADEYVLDDPNAGKISRNELAEYMDGMKQMVRSMLDGQLPDPFLDLSEIVTREEAGEITAWAWWTVPGTVLMGSGLIKVGSKGVVSEVLTYYTKLPI